MRDIEGRVALAMFDFRKPIVGAINGAAIGMKPRENWWYAIEDISFSL